MSIKLPIGIQSFQDIRKNGYVYVDKTKYIKKLLNEGKVYFLSRPRRFGKSLFVSTLEAYFRGQKELFDGLFLENDENSKPVNERWISYPIIRFSLSGGDYNDPEGLNNMLSFCMNRCEKEYGISGVDESLSVHFAGLIEALFQKTGEQVVVLVDEYDKPLLETMSFNPDLEEKNRTVFKNFFSVLKDEDQYLKFVFFTGVTKFSKVSIFSDLNQLRDMSYSDAYSGICGITEKELLDCFQQNILEVANANGETPEQSMKKLKDMYDGYRFSASGVNTYNPFSLFNAFADRRYGSYWFETGTPTFLVRVIRQSSYELEDFFAGIQASKGKLMDFTGDPSDLIPLLYQTGYLTICDYDAEFDMYTLSWPNQEVKYGFLNGLFPLMFTAKNQNGPFFTMHFVKDLRCGNVNGFMSRLKSLLVGIPYPEGNQPYLERKWQNQIYLIFFTDGSVCSV